MNHIENKIVKSVGDITVELDSVIKELISTVKIEEERKWQKWFKEEMAKIKKPDNSLPTSPPVGARRVNALERKVDELASKVQLVVNYAVSGLADDYDVLKELAE